MSEKYFIQKSTMTAIADNFREVTGRSESLSTDDMMSSDFGGINTEVSAQSDLIDQISNALNGKAAGGGDIELPTLTNPAVSADILAGKESINGSGNIITGTIPTKTSDDLTTSGPVVNVPAGYFAESAYKAIDVATQATPTISVDSAGKITASITQAQGFTPGGTKTATQQLTTQAAKTITPSTSSQTAVAKDRYTTGVITVGAIPDGYMVANEISAQDTLISQIQSALQGKAAGSGSNELLKEEGSFSYTEDVGDAPGTTAYTLTTNNLHLSKRHIVEIYIDGTEHFHVGGANNYEVNFHKTCLILYRFSLHDNFTIMDGTSRHFTGISGVVVSENEIYFPSASIHTSGGEADMLTAISFSFITA